MITVFLETPLASARSAYKFTYIIYTVNLEVALKVNQCNGANFLSEFVRWQRKSRQPTTKGLNKTKVTGQKIKIKSHSCVTFRLFTKPITYTYRYIIKI